MTIGGPSGAPGALEGDVRSESVWVPRAVVGGDPIDLEVARQLATERGRRRRVAGIHLGLVLGHEQLPERPEVEAVEADASADHRRLLAGDDELLDLHLSAEEGAVDREVALDRAVLEVSVLVEGLVDRRAAQGLADDLRLRRKLRHPDVEVRPAEGHAEDAHRRHVDVGVDLVGGERAADTRDARGRTFELRCRAAERVGASEREALEHEASAQLSAAMHGERAEDRPERRTALLLHLHERERAHVDLRAVEAGLLVEPAVLEVGVAFVELLAEEIELRRVHGRLHVEVTALADVLGTTECEVEARVRLE